MRRILFLTLGLAVCYGLTTSAKAGATLDAVKSRGKLLCSVNGPSSPGYAVPNNQGVWQGFNVDLCRAFAAAIFGDPQKVDLIPLNTVNRFPALQTGEVDVLTNNSNWTLLRQAQLKFSFPAIVLYDGQGVMVPKKLNVSSMQQLDGAVICVPPGSTSERTLAEYFRAHKMQFKPLVIEAVDQLIRAYAEGRCDAFSSDATTLAARRQMLGNPGEHVILSERLSKEAVSIAVRRGDEEFSSIISWIFNALVNAEEFGITQANIDKQLESSNPDIRKLLGVDKGLGDALGLDNRWAYNAIKAVGNYGEIFERNLGPKTPLGMERGLNKLWKDGGALFVPPTK